MFDLVQNIASVLKPANVQEVSHGFQEKRAQERDNRNSSHSEGDGDAGRTGENTILSVKAVILFLEDFVETRLASEAPFQDGTSDDAVLAPWMRNRPSNSNQPEHTLPDDAANAYTRTARSSQYQPKANKIDDQESLRTVYGLIKDLRSLKARGITHLSISSAYGFLEGIRISVKESLGE
ncbi:MAG: hypothetical protein ACRBCK_01235 [Alphaproteobacteria bacterium]